MNKAEELIACLEGEIAKRDARMAEFEKELQAGATAVENCELFRAELAAIKARELVAIEFRQFMTSVVTGAGLLSCGKQSKGLAAELSATAYKYLLGEPVYEAKAQGVVIPPSPYMPGSQPTDFTDYELGEIHGRIAMWEEVKRLNAAPVQQVSVPDGKVCVPVEVLRLYEFMAASFTPFTSQHEQIAISLRKAKAAMLAAPAAPAADGWISVSERLPGEDDQVLCWCEDETVAWEEVSSHHNSFFTDMTHELLPVTHWMPLPAAPAAHRAQGVV